MAGARGAPAHSALGGGAGCVAAVARFGHHDLLEIAIRHGARSRVRLLALRRSRFLLGHGHPPTVEPSPPNNCSQSSSPTRSRNAQLNSPVSPASARSALPISRPTTSGRTSPRRAASEPPLSNGVTFARSSFTPRL